MINDNKKLNKNINNMIFLIIINQSIKVPSIALIVIKGQSIATMYTELTLSIFFIDIIL